MKVNDVINSLSKTNWGISVRGFCSDRQVKVSLMTSLRKLDQEVVEKKNLDDRKH